MPKPEVRRSGTLVARTAETLRRAIADGVYKPGQRLPSEAQMTLQQGVSRTVVREAVASLRADGLVEARQGAGVFVLAPVRAENLPFQGIDFDKISNILELLELRIPVEVEAAGLAALRRSPGQEEQILRWQDEIDDCERQGRPTAEADFALHLAIADATNNPRFREFLLMMGRGIIPRAALTRDPSDEGRAVDLGRLHGEHAQIVDAILEGNVEAAREAMLLHLKGSHQRYRNMLARRG